MLPGENTNMTEPFAIHMKAESVDAACFQIIDVSKKWAAFWPNSHGWSPSEAADLMKQDLMDRHLDMATSLQNWPKRLLEDDASGELVLAWTTLGSVLEGVLKVYMCVYCADWWNDPDVPTSNGRKLNPDDTFFNRIIEFVGRKKLLPPEEIEFFRMVRDQRNLIHPFKVGSVRGRTDFLKAVMLTAAFYESVDTRLPYPDCCHL